jgi:hypothetical protein
VGNKADISGNDLLEYWESDPRTALVLLYLESFGNPRRASAPGRQRPAEPASFEDRRTSSPMPANASAQRMVARRMPLQSIPVGSRSVIS